MNENRWSRAATHQWYRRQPWLVGCNFTPSTAINQLEMWQADTFDPVTIERELGWARDIGFNTVRVYLHDLAWQSDAEGFKQRIAHFLQLADRCHIRPMFVIFDDCWRSEFRAGKQPDPLPGVHNSGWIQSPGTKIVTDPSAWPRLERYVTDIIGAFAADERILMWDLYNEPGNNNLGERSLPLLQAAFEWARAASPSQPLSAGLWSDHREINDFLLQASDVITFHNYNDAANLNEQIAGLKAHGRPLICTEYMARTRGSRFQTHLPIFAAENVGCLNWGLVSGKTQTIFPWGSPQGSPEPTLWFHDIFTKDGAPFDAEEVDFIRRTITTHDS